MALTEIVIRQAKTGGKSRKLTDGKGLYLLLTPAGGKLWRFDYRQNGKRGTLSLGQWPEVSLVEARTKRDEARKTLTEGSDPALEKRRAKARAKGDVGNTFKAIADEYIAMRKADGARPYSASTAAKAEWHAALLAPSIGHMPVASIEPGDILAALRKVEANGTLETANRCLQFAGRVMRYAVATARVTSDPSRDLKGALPAPRVTHYAAILDPVKLGGLLRAIDSYDGDGVTRLGLQLAPHVFVRPGELRTARWEELDLAAAIWTIPAEKTKMRKPHSVPLSRQALAIFTELQGLTGGGEGYQGFIFPSIRTRLRPMSENTLNAALRRLGYSSDEITAHGFRATASTLLNESGKWSADAIERALAHGHSDAVRGVYARGQHWDERVTMAQWWSDHLDTLRAGAKVLSFGSGYKG